MKSQDDSSLVRSRETDGYGIRRERSLLDKELYGKIVEHRRKFYHVGYADYDKDYPGLIEFLPLERCLKEWGADYGEMLEHFVHGERLSFSDLLKRIAEIQSRFRALDR